MLARRVVAVLVVVTALVAPSVAAAQEEVTVRSKRVVTQNVRVKVSVITIGAKVVVRSVRRGEQLDQVRVKGAKAGKGSDLLQLGYARFDQNGEATKKRSGTGQLSVGWQNPDGRRVTRYIGVTRDGLEAF